MFTKFAKLEVLEVRSAPSRVSAPSLTKFASFDEYRTEDGYVYVRVRAISSRVNKNNDGWPSTELAKSYKTFVGKPIFVDHHNSDPKKARGIIVDAALHVEDLTKASSFDPYYSAAPGNHLPPTWIELLLEVDAKKFPKLARAVVSGEIDSVSMGANVEISKCSHCGNEARSPEQYCKHVQSKGAYFDFYDEFGNKTSKKAYEDCYDIGFFEISFVFDPADETALVSDIKHAKVAAIYAEANDAYGDFEAALEQLPEVTSEQNPDAENEFGDWTAASGLSLGLGLGLSTPAWAREKPEDDEDKKDEDKKEKDVLDWPKESANEYGDMTYLAAGNEMPQSDMTHAPIKVDTLRQEQICPICGSDMDDGVCGVCNYQEPPEGFDNPDLTKAKEVDEQTHQQDAAEATQGQQPGPSDVQPGPSAGPAPLPSGAPPATSNVHGSGAVRIEDKTSAAQQGGRINTQERPILPVTRKLSDKPIRQKTVSEAKKPVLSNSTKENMTDTIKTADGASPQGEGVAADKRVDVEGIGAVTGDPLSGIKHENVEKDTGDFTGPHTDTWNGDKGDSLGQESPVTSDTGDFFTVSHEVVGAEAEDNAGDDIGDGGGSAKAGGPTWDSSDAGIPDHQPARIDLLAPLKEEVGEGTKTDPDEQYRSLKHTEPTTKGDANGNDVGGPIGTAVSKVIKALKLAETEIELGILDGEKKFERIAELESADDTVIDSQLATLSKVKTAGLKKPAVQKTAGAGKMPSFKPVTASFDIEANSVGDEAFSDSIF